MGPILIIGIFISLALPLVAFGEALGTQSSNRSQSDTDNDGLADDVEVKFLTDRFDADSDDDGIFDGQEGLNISKSREHPDNDPDGDGWNNAMDADSDDDGILDGTEIGLTEGDINLSATDLTKGRFQPDLDPSTTTDPLNNDTDGDSWKDGDEDTNANGKYEPDKGEKNPNLKDFDDDNLHDDTQDDDDDNDGMPDEFEELYPRILNPKDPRDRDFDYDADGYTNYREYLGDDNKPGNKDWSDPTDSSSRPVIDTDYDRIPNEADAFPWDPAASKDDDGDGCPDEWNAGKGREDSTSEPKLILDIFPDNPGACIDSDNDFMPDSINNDLNTDPSLVEDVDDDNDGQPDWWEQQFSFNPLNSSDSMEDADADGFSNLNEYIEGTNPRDPLSYPEFSNKPRRDLNSDDWVGFIAFIILTVIAVMLVAAFVGFYIVRKRSEDEEFWADTFGNGRELGAEPDEEARKRYRAWQRRVQNENISQRFPRQKIKLEIIGGPPDEKDHAKGITHPHRRAGVGRPRSKSDPRFSGRYCLWCDKGITYKYIKRCPMKRQDGTRCPDGPFCSERCLREHLEFVPHHHDVNF